jgi:dolichol-phosphate mannosyltransferase
MRAAVAEADEDDAIAVLEGDGTSDPEILPVMLAAMDGSCDVVIASRYVGAGRYLNFPLKRLLLSRSANFLLRAVCGLPRVRDYTIFYRLYRCGPLKRALAAYGDRFTSVGGFACNAEMLLRMRKFVREIREVPLVYDYGKKKGASGMRIGGNLASYLKLFRIFAFEGPPEA